MVTCPSDICWIHNIIGRLKSDDMMDIVQVPNIVLGDENRWVLMSQHCEIEGDLG
jgi:hypothetical protein